MDVDDAASHFAPCPCSVPVLARSHVRVSGTAGCIGHNQWLTLSSGDVRPYRLWPGRPTVVIRGGLPVVAGCWEVIQMMRRVTAFAALVAMLVMVPVVAFAAKPVPTSSVDESWSGCQVTVTYTWEGFRGSPKHQAYVGVADTYLGTTVGGGGWPMGYSSELVSPKQGSFQHTFDLVPLASGTHNFYVWGKLLDAKGQEVEGSLKMSDSVTAQPCKVAGAPGS